MAETETPTIAFGYDWASDAVMLKSPITGGIHVFPAKEMRDFLDWLRTSRHRREKWYALEMRQSFEHGAKVVSLCQGNGSHVDVFAFSSVEELYARQVEEFAKAFAVLEVQVIGPARGMKDKGMVDEQIVRAIETRNFFDLPCVWPTETA